MTEMQEFVSTGPAEGLVRLKLLVAYDGAPFHGFAEQGHDTRTVARVMRKALGRLVGYEPELTVAGRTDAGVHAWGQIVAVDVPEATLDRFDLARIQKSLNKQMAPSVVVRSIERADPGFDARFSPIGRRYRYTVLNTLLPNPFLTTTTWHVRKPLDLDSMNEACSAIIGEHDFSSFCKKPVLGRLAGLEPVPGRLPRGHLVRRVHSAAWVLIDDDTVRFEVEAKAFCHQMVRSFVGMLVSIGVGDAAPAEMKRLLELRDRKEVATPAPPQGLCLWEVLL